MAFIYVTEHPEIRPRAGGDQVLEMPPLASYQVGNAGASTQSPAFQAGTKIVQVHTDSICSIEFGANPTAVTTKGRMAANETRNFRVNPGDKVAAILNT